MPILLLSFIILLIASLFIKCISTTKNPKKNLPPSPPKLPGIGNFHQLGNYPHRSLQSLAKKHGPIILLHFGSVPVLVITSPDAAREIMKTHDLIFSNRPKATIPSKLLYDSKDMAFSPYSEYWRQVRSIGVLNLLSNKRVQSYKRTREAETALMIEKINNNRLVNLSDMFKSLTNDVVCRVALGRKLGGEEGRRFKELSVEFVELLGVFCVGDYVPWLWWVDRVSGLFGRVERVAKGIDEFLEGVLSDHMEKKKEECEGEGKNFVDILLEIQRENKLGFPVSRDTIKALIMLTEPVEPHAYQYDKTSQYLYVHSMPALKLNLCHSAYRFASLERSADAKILGYDVKVGTQVIINAWAIRRDPLVWEDPEEFRPERFLNSSTDFKGIHFELIPFGAGRRGCPGALFAMAVIELALANLLYSFDIALPDGQRAEDLDMTETSGITVYKKSPILVVATPYSS
ncbi:hypothetical protein LguiB_006159 [Lonicera macranthoides]